ncbi:hypothetical protein BKA56DRAFT_271224 [Ilyonectria sp. MPI-CAGE-AT-0026]|nr:hypothetical protein BKA56DRAFT_271224 [Ilyonectria sp. MPI-CAGE-AT-0026]
MSITCSISSQSLPTYLAVDVPRPISRPGEDITSRAPRNAHTQHHMPPPAELVERCGVIVPYSDLLSSGVGKALRLPPSQDAQHSVRVARRLRRPDKQVGSSRSGKHPGVSFQLRYPGSSITTSSQRRRSHLERASGGDEGNWGSGRRPQADSMPSPRSGRQTPARGAGESLKSSCVTTQMHLDALGSFTWRRRRTHALTHPRTHRLSVENHALWSSTRLLFVVPLRRQAASRSEKNEAGG